MPLNADQESRIVSVLKRLKRHLVTADASVFEENQRLHQTVAPLLEFLGLDFSDVESALERETLAGFVKLEDVATSAKNDIQHTHNAPSRKIPTSIPNPYIVKEDALPLQTRGAQILDKNEKPVRLRCVNWGGGQLKHASVGGLSVQYLHAIPEIIRALHFNCVRLIYSLDLAFDRIQIPEPARTLAANPDLLETIHVDPDPDVGPHDLDPTAGAESAVTGLILGEENAVSVSSSVAVPHRETPVPSSSSNSGEDHKTNGPPNRGDIGKKKVVSKYTAFELLSLTVDSLTKQNLMVVLNNHNSDAGWCCSPIDGNGLWYTDSYPESMWLAHIKNLTIHFRDNPYVVGFDLRNEVRSAGGTVPTWFNGIPEKDWAPAALRGGVVVHTYNPDMLVVVGGVWYNMFLCEVYKFPIHELIPGRVVYESHAYSWFSSSLQARGFLNLYIDLVVSVFILTWGFILLFGILQRYYPFVSLTRFLIAVESRFKRRIPTSDGQAQRRRSCCKGRCSRGCADPVLCGAVLSTLALPIIAFLVGRAAYCSIWATVGVLIGNLCSIVMSILSLLLWLIIAIREFVSSRWLMERVLLLCRSQESRESEGESLSETEMADITESSPTGFLTGFIGSESPTAVHPADMRPPGISRVVSTGSAVTAGMEKPRSRVSVLFGLMLTALLVGFSYMADTIGSYESVKAEYDKNWGYLVRKNIAPVWLGEFGIGNAGSVWVASSGSRDSYWNSLSWDHHSIARKLDMSHYTRNMIGDFIDRKLGVVQGQQQLDSTGGEAGRGAAEARSVTQDGNPEINLQNSGGLLSAISQAERRTVQQATNDDFWSILGIYQKELNLSWAYWPIDGQRDLAEDSFGILNYDYMRIRHLDKIMSLSPLLKLKTNLTTGDTYPPGFGPEDYPPGMGPQ